MKLIERVYKLLSIRDRSEKEIRDYVKRRNFKFKMAHPASGGKGRDLITDSEVEEVIKDLKEKGLINDEKFAESWIASRSRKYGVIKIKQELAQKGIRDFQYKITNEEQIMEKLLERKLKSWKNLELIELKKKAIDFLLRRGFEFGVVKAVVEKLSKKG